MSELNKLNNMGMAKSRHQRDMEAMQRGASMPGTLVAPGPSTPEAPAPREPSEMSPEEAAIAAMQEDNLRRAKSDPGMAARLNAVAKARAKFYGEGQ